jgi:hypothetical protein
MVILRNQDRHFWPGRGERNSPRHSETSRNRLKLGCKLTHVNCKICEVPLDAHQKEIPFRVLVLVGVQNVPVRAVYEVRNRGVDAFLVRATDQEDGAVLQGDLRSIPRRL